MELMNSISNPLISRLIVYVVESRSSQLFFYNSTNGQFTFRANSNFLKEDERIGRDLLSPKKFFYKRRCISIIYLLCKKFDWTKQCSLTSLHTFL